MQVHHNSKFTTEQVLEIKQLLKTKPTYIIARRFKVPVSRINRIYYEVCYGRIK